MKATAKTKVGSALMVEKLGLSAGSKQTVIIGMSGGVDSSVAAFLLKEQGFHVIALFMKNWEEQDEHGECRSAEDFEDVVRVCNHLSIPYYSVNFSKQYWNNVFKYCLEQYKKGYTPNPDILCNKEIKFKVLLEKAKELGGDFLATGHYCQKREHNGKFQLLKGLDPNKDQSYFLYAINGTVLKDVLFPLGHLKKEDVRKIAREQRLPTAEKKDSTGICFIGKRNFKEFLKQFIPFSPGNFETQQGEIVGQHDGVPFYTIGQRKGLGIGGPGEAWFVVGKDLKRNVVVVSQGADNHKLFTESLEAVELSWIARSSPSPLPFSCSSKIRYRQEDHSCIINAIEEGKAQVTFPEPQRAVTIGQSIVFYHGDVCLGGGIIQ